MHTRHRMPILRRSSTVEQGAGQLEQAVKTSVEVQEIEIAARRAIEGAVAHYKAALRQSEKAIAYLRGRGIMGATAARFGLGYARAHWHDLAEVLDGCSSPVVEATGLVARCPNGVGYDRFRDRIMFPIRDLDGVVVAFGGRALTSQDAKYLNSPETLVFRKREILYGLFEARQAIESTGQCIVVEGYFDVIGPAQAGVQNVVATLGTACTGEQLRAVQAIAKEVVFCFDGDGAGRLAAARALVTVLPLASDASRFKFVFLSEGSDPDSLVREQGGKAFQLAVSAALSLAEFLPQHAAEGCNLAHMEGRAKAATRAGALWRMLPAGPVANALLLDCAERFEISPASLLAHWQRADDRKEP